MEFLYISLILVLTFIMRIIPRVGLKYGFGGDTFFHLYMGEMIRVNNHKIPDKIHRVVLDHDYTYPYFYHWILSYFNSNNRLILERITGALLDTLNTLIIYVFTVWAVANFNIDTPSYFPEVTALLFSLSPAFLTVAAGPRAFCGSPRILGQTLYLIHILGFLVFSVSDNYFILGLSILSASFLFISSKFSVQILIFFGIFFTTFLSTLYAPIVFLSLLISIIITKGRVLKVVEGHYRHSEYYISLLLKTENGIGFKRDWLDFRAYAARVLTNLKKLTKGKIVDFFMWVFGERYFIHFTIIAFPQIIFLFFVFNKYPINDYLMNFLFLWVGSSLLWFLITSVGYLKFLGEGERYLEFSVAGSLFLAVLYILLNGMEQYLFIYISYCLTLYFFHIFIFRKRFFKQNKDYVEEETFFAKFNLLEKGAVLPIGNEWQLLYRTTHPLLTYGANVDKRKISIAEFRRLYKNAHLPAKHLGEFIDKYKAKYILTSKQNLEIYINEVYFDKKEFQNITELLLESKNFVVLKFKEQ